MDNKPSKMLERLIQEASDPETDPERLQELTQPKYFQVHRILWKNPNLPEEVWRKALLNGHPEAWANPMALFYLLAWAPREKDWRTLEAAARSATESLWMEPERCSVEGKQLLAAKVMEWWTTWPSAVDMMTFLGRWSSSRGIGSQEHKDVMRILVKCVRTTPDLTKKDLDLLHSIEQWSKGLQQDPPNLSEDNHSQTVKQMHQAITNYPFTYRFSVDAILEEVAYQKSKDYDSQAHKEAKEEHNRLLADLIRQEMPIPLPPRKTMANEPNKMLETLIQEASNPETDPERLQELATYRNDSIWRAAWQNPNLPEDAWRKALLEGHPEAWANPMAPFYFLTWIPRDNDWRTLEETAKSATESLWMEPERCSVEGKQLLAAKVMEWWATWQSAVDMIDFLGRWAFSRGIGSQEHKDVARILVKCARTTPHLTPKDLDLLQSIEQWSKGLQRLIHWEFWGIFQNGAHVPLKHTSFQSQGTPSRPWSGEFKEHDPPIAAKAIAPSPHQTMLGSTTPSSRNPCSVFETNPSIQTPVPPATSLESERIHSVPPACLPSPP